MLLVSCSFVEPGYSHQLQETFSPGDFKPLTSKATRTPTQTASAEVLLNSSEESGQAAGVYTCPQDGCVRVFQRVSALQKHLSFEKCTQSLERHTFLDLAKMGCKSALEEGVGALHTINPPPVSEVLPATQADEGWALRAAKSAYCFSDKQKEYLLAKFRIGQTTGQKLDAEIVAREMWRAHGADCLRLFSNVRISFSHADRLLFFSPEC